ncbi:unnamed protein product [Rotaria magnacalcarata]|uniref:ZMYM2-like/QRICH1 C-terminal domain-containing protein n=1 Tax=Rotaria magnacalcarata TaxID=392030 RepID=A0A814EWY1_9BILA|nr:unnamed protein product [Rotaria magnacalcarata]CAF1439680.1 unnamed protein product [Rotaria magnacalcarata]CAF2090674.1 unnamed protein product [Rotaria magnacalcarata]CAF3836768.1 unnamed protein product [Rotaria magnacalcarata]CAF3861590.1 unnamed protein product [Rotaria magnacalcarata]
MATAATSLADFHQMIKLFGADADEMTGTTTTTITTTATAATFVSTDELDDDDDDEDENENELQLDEESPNSSGGEETISRSSIATSSVQINRDDQSSTKPISSAAAAARLSRLANQRIDSNRFLICSGTNSYNTIRKTKHEVRRFALYLEDTFGENCPIDELEPEQLCTYLKHYFGNVRKADNTEYEPDTLRSFMLSIERYLKSRKYPCNILESPVFAPCREVIQEKRDTWAKPNKSVCNSKVEAFTSQHETLLRKMNIITRDTPDGLLLELLINNSKYFDQRGYESTINRSLLWGDLEIKTDSTTSLEYIEYKRTPQISSNKDSTTNEITTNLRAYAISSHSNECPVVALRLLSYHRPPQCSNADAPFYIVPRTSADQRVWYKTIRAGRHRLDLLLQQAMQKAGISGKFSCMSLRKGKIKGLLIPTMSSNVASNTNLDNSSMSTSPSTSPTMDDKSKINVVSPLSITEQQLSSTKNNHKRSTSSTSTSNCSELLDLSAHNNNNNNGVINLAKKIKQEPTPPSLLLPMPSSVLNNGTISNHQHLTSMLPLQQQSQNHPQRSLVTVDDLPALVAQTPTSVSISSNNTNNNSNNNNNDNNNNNNNNNNNKRKLTSHDTFTALYSAAHSKSSRQSKMNVLRKYLEETLGLVEFLTLYEYLRRNSHIKLQGTPIEHYEHVLPVLLTLLMLENTA